MLGAFQGHLAEQLSAITLRGRLLRLTTNYW